MYQYSDWKCGDCTRSFCIAIDDEDSKKAEDIPACPRCESKLVTLDVDAGPSRQETAQQDAANRPGVIALVAAVRILNSPWDTSEVPEGCGLASTWFSQEELNTLVQIKPDRQALAARLGQLKWSELEVRRLLFLKGIRCWSYAEVGEELGVGRNRVVLKYRRLCKVFGLVHEADEE